MTNPKILRHPLVMLCRLLALFCPLFFFATVASAALQFANHELIVKATPEDKELVAHYTFTNPGPDPIWIVQLSTSCGCTKAIVDRTELQPGETGTITAIYTIGLSQGRQTHAIDIQTSEPNSPPYVLKITADLPTGTTPFTNESPAVVLTPREFIWSHPPYAAKTITIALEDPRITETTATCDSDQFELKLDETTRPATLQVTPKASAASTRAEITLKVTRAEGPPVTQKIPLTLISLKGTRSQ